ncbi:MAG: hypothetical protein LCI00_25205 [Chloroflexi bacterium]|nr:hypothetical protein [Chloroflexota bacterium]MCC6895715.1 hypothetical protein [Anaerolineae bacterium]
MPRFLLKLGFYITFLLVLMTALSHVIGSTQPINPVLRGFTEGCEGQPQPCWYGVVPGVMNLTEGADVLRTSGYLQKFLPQYIQGEGIDCKNVWVNRQVYERWKWPRDNRVWGINISQCTGVRLGTWINLFGEPEYVVPNNPSVVLIYPPDTMFWVSSVNNVWVSPDSPINSIRISMPELLLSPPLEAAYRWHGFGTRRIYEKYEPDIEGNWFLGG